MDIADLKRTVADRLCLLGNTDLGSALTLSAPEDVEEELKRRAWECTPGAGYCVGSSNSVTDYVLIENSVAMINTIFKYSTYPAEVQTAVGQRDSCFLAGASLICLRFITAGCATILGLTVSTQCRLRQAIPIKTQEDGPGAGSSELPFADIRIFWL